MCEEIARERERERKTEQAGEANEKERGNWKRDDDREAVGDERRKEKPMPTGTTALHPFFFRLVFPPAHDSLSFSKPFRHDRTFRNYAALIKEFAGEGSPTRGDGRGGDDDDAPLQVSFFFLSSLELHFSTVVFAVLVPRIFSLQRWEGNARRARQGEQS